MTAPAPPPPVDGGRRWPLPLIGAFAFAFLSIVALHGHFLRQELRGDWVYLVASLYAILALSAGAATWLLKKRRP